MSEDDFPTTSLDDNIWLKDPVPQRHLCIHDPSQPNCQCSYPCPYSLDFPFSTLDDIPYHEMMDLGDISEFQDIMMTTSDEDILDLEDGFRL